MKKLSKYFLVAIGLMLGFVVNAQSVKAATLVYESSGIYYERFSADGSNYASWVVSNYLIDGQVGYCIEPGTEEGNPLHEASWSATGLPNDIKEKMLLTAYYGYTYPGHQTQKYRVATQGLIWSYILGPNSTVRYSTERYNKGAVYDVTAEENEIKRLVANHYTKPSFNTKSYTLQVGESLTLTDTNNVLSNYSVSVSGASYSVSGNKLTITPTRSGNITFDLKKKMNYSSNYKIFVGDGIQNMLTAGNVDPVNAKFGVNAYYGEVEINKKDSETGVAQGQATLNGAVYGVYNQSGELITKITTNDTGYAKSDKVLKYGSYYLQEITPSDGYYLDNTRYSFDSKGKALVNLDVKEKVVKNYVSILKQYDYVNGNTTILNAEKGIVFEIYYPDGRLYGDITTDKNGYATLDLPYGKWKFHQVNTTENFDKIYDFYVTVDYDSELEQYYNVLNNKITAYLQVYKTDSETGETIAIKDTTFKILNLDTNEYVSQYVGGKVYSEFTTDENGMFITYLKLEAGHYKLIEVSSPNGYLLNTDGLEFTIGNDTEYYYSTYGAFVTIYFEDNAIKGQIEIIKKGEEFVIDDESFHYEEKLLENVTFQIIASEDILSADKRHLYYHKGDIVDTIVTNEDGYAISSKLPLGKYILKEINTIDGYELDTKEYLIELKEKDNLTSVIYHKELLLNHLSKGHILITKVDSKGNKLSGVEFVIYDSNKENIIYRGVTDKNGIIDLSLPYGKYYYQETKALDGYLIDDKLYEFVIDKDNKDIKIDALNHLIEVPNTSKEEFPTFEVISFILCGMGLGVVIYGKNKKNK